MENSLKTEVLRHKWLSWNKGTFADITEPGGMTLTFDDTDDTFKRERKLRQSFVYPF